MSTAEDHRHMAHALRLAARGLYTTEPNPRVGCVLVKDGRVVGEGWHRYAGSPHAEINALAQASAAAAGATAYVTLEPCCHHGRTPPCTEALIRAGVQRVVFAMRDPNPQVTGAGGGALQAAGIEVQSGVLADEAIRLNPGFDLRMRTGRPWVRCKLAMSLDGRTAMKSGESQWITGSAARRDVHHLRARSSAIMTGIDTVLADDPSLTARLEDDPDTEVRQPLRVILDSRLRLPATARLLDLPGNTLVFTGADASAAEARYGHAAVSFVTVPVTSGRLDLAAVFQHLGSLEVNEVHVEAGPTLSGALLQAGLVDELVIYMAPHLMGDAARGLFSLSGLDSMTDRIQLAITDMRAIGQDWRITATVKQ
ncbi:MAG: bifunctional diaminohydroxyphosphoribosylaminopyrimidine deaminase/5-amino-6-(5-phosphoribosylamino)uracil reductase RibD [Gammaproteobacteria bacterium]|nr:MAG: bifunctional diaminohydroxyphosphoribosylaminopyrimidine deaminase/5-amino-6-(5-phosphoribosylamino)uracil reductase RibD [Gammaproteobacteria bacterium]